MDKNIITVRIDDYTEMAEVLLNNNYIMMGNFWDFHPGCYSIGNTESYGNFKGHISLAKAVKENLEKQGQLATIVTEKYNYDKKYQL
jgi:hypothetical protein